MILEKERIKTIGIYVGVSLLNVLILIWVLQLWKADLKVPFVYAGDGSLACMMIKGLIDNGSHLYNSFMGMPTGAMLYDFVGSDGFHFLIIKIISLLSSDWAWVMNVYFLLAFPLTALCCLYVFRHFGCSYMPSIAGSLLYTFLPFRLLRGEGHLFLGAYYIVPLMVMTILWVFSGEVRLFHFKWQAKEGKGRGKLISAIIICLITASSGVYYAFFACLFLFIAGIKAFSKQRNSNAFLVPVFLIFVILAGVLINLSPTLIYQYRNGRNEVVAKRSPGEAEIYGLKVTHLLLPTAGHRISELAKIEDIYRSTTPLNNENTSSTLGMIGSMGFVILIAVLFWGPSWLKSETLEHLGLLNIAGVLYATIGGFGSIFALIYPQFRALNRISVFIAFFSFFAVLIILERWKGHFKSLFSRGLFCFFVCAVTILGILDQTSESFVPRYDLQKSEYTSDHNFITTIETSVPHGSMIFQLPYMPFPEYGGLHKMRDYDHFKGYLHSKTLRWSYGAMKGREGDTWLRWVNSKDLKHLVEIISLAGFNGIYVDRYGYPDNGAELKGQLETLLNTTPIVSSNNRLVFFDLRGFAKNWRGSRPPNEVKSGLPGFIKLEQALLPPVTNNIAYNIEIIREMKSYVEIAGWAYVNGTSSSHSKISLVLRSDKNTYRVETASMRRPDVTAHFKSLDLDDSGFLAAVFKEEIEAGTYEVGIHIKKGDSEGFQYTGRTIRIGK